MTSISKQLEDVGLTPNQSVVYLSLFRAGESKAGEIIKKTGLHRNLVYRALEDLTNKKLIMVSRVKGIAVYKVLSPSRLLADAQEKERAAKQLIEELAALSKKANNQEVIIYEGIDEFRRHAMRSYSLAKNGGLVRYLGTSAKWHEVIGSALEKDLNSIQREKKIHMRGITKEPFPGLKSYLDDIKGFAEVRFNPLVSSDTNNIEILEDRIGIQSFVEPYLVIEIINEELAKNYQSYFDFLWKNSKSA
jgi:sugar-specific transcriptional regulator TrmB